MGGFWERLIHSVKKCLRKVIGRETYEQLQTLLAEIESVINARTLTYLLKVSVTLYLHVWLIYPQMAVILKFKHLSDPDKETEIETVIL